ncbi:MAG TPA: hypothetical protein VG095_05095, partial [Chthoniobacterales bacterium]|nr:hypothetical protein [Chthoniobacterales bacterium]
MALPASLLDPTRPKRPAGSFYRRWTWRRQVVASGMRLLVFGTFALLIWGSWYLANRGLGRQFRTTVVEELRKRGIDASVRRLTLDPFRGLVAQDLRIYDSRNRNMPLAVVSEVSLDINYAALLHRQPFLNAVDVRGASLSFPRLAGEPKASQAELREFHARVYFPPDQIQIQQAEGNFCGVRISATGQLLKRPDFKPGRPLSEADLRQRLELLQRIAEQLSGFNFVGGAPTVQVNFSGDLSQMEHARVEATLRGQRMQRGAYEIKSFSAALDWTEQKLNLRQCEWSDAAGSFAGSASWSRESKAAEFQAESSVHLRQLADAFGFGHMLADVTFVAPPVLQISGTLSFAEAVPRWSALGHVTLGGFTFKSIPFQGGSADFSADAQRIMLREVRLRHATGDVTAEFFDAPGDFRLNVESSMNPAAVRVLATGGLRNFLNEWEWPKAPAVRVSLRGTSSRDAKTWTGEGEIALSRTRFRGVWMNSATADVEIAGGALTFRNLHVVRNEGVGTGTFTYDDPKHEVRLENIRTTLWPNEAIYWIEPKLHKVVAPYKFRSPPRLIANGLVQFHGGRNTRLEIAAEVPSGMDYVFLGKNLPFDRVDGDILITDEHVQLIGLEGELLGGKVRADAGIHTAKDDERHKATITVEGVDFPRLTDLYFDYKTARGQLFGKYEFDGWGDDTRRMVGHGNLRVQNGDVFAIPVFGPLSGLLNAI